MSKPRLQIVQCIGDPARASNQTVRERDALNQLVSTYTNLSGVDKKIVARKLAEMISAEMSADADTTEVEIEIKANGAISDVMEEYLDYIREFKHVAAIGGESGQRLERILATADVAELNEKWRFNIMDVSEWTGFEDGKPRAILPGSCRSETYGKLKAAIVETLGAGTPMIHVEDVIVYLFLGVWNDSPVGKLDLNKIFQLDFRHTVRTGSGKVVLLLDSCSFDPRKKGGDELYLDYKLIAEHKALVERVFPDALTVEGRGRFENVSDEVDTDDEEMDEQSAAIIDSEAKEGDDSSSSSESEEEMKS